MTHCHSLIATLNAAAERALRPLIGDGDVALLDFPAHSNVGDSAIWLGELACLRALTVRRLRYACDFRTYDRERLAQRLGAGTILLHGGANFGDLWPEYQQFRERVITDFPDNAIVQLPQSIHFRDRAAVDRARRIVNGHSRLTLLLRDRRSHDFAANEFRAPSVLCPDLAFCLGPLARPASPTQAMLWLARTDHEATGDVVPDSARHLLVDWIEEPPTRLARASRGLSRLVARSRLAARMLRRPLSLTYTPLAAMRLDRGCRLLGSARAVITDRLHGHILCVLLGIPHVVLDNNYGKVRGFHQSWTAGCALAHWSESPADALAMADLLARDAVPLPRTSGVAPCD